MNSSTAPWRALTILSTLALLWASGSAGAADEPILCDQTYALCAAAKCVPHPRNPDYAICACDNFDGDSVGLESCAKRAGTTGSNDTHFIVSTFSFENTPAYEMTCPTDTIWTNCMDAPCTVDPRDPSRSLCSCPIMGPAEGIITLGGDCDTSTCANSYWSAALASSGPALQKKLAEKQGIHINEAIPACGTK